MQLTGRTVVVTGGAKGIGQAISSAFHDHGDYVVMAGREDTGFAKELGERARFFPCDVRRPQELHAVARAACEWRGQLDIFINNAGFSGWRRADEVEEHFWDTMIATNLKGVFFGCQAASAQMSTGGSIINISSLAGKRGTANNAVYCATKFGVNGITQALAKEFGPRGIRVNALCPVLIRTEGLLEALRGADAPVIEGDVEAFLTKFAAAQSALGRLPRSEELAQCCLFLASPGASAVTGQCLNVDCGVLPQ